MSFGLNPNSSTTHSGVIMFKPGTMWSTNVLRSSGVNRKSGAVIVRYSQKKNFISFVFYCFENPSIALTFEPQVGFSANFTPPNDDFNQN